MWPPQKDVHRQTSGRKQGGTRTQKGLGEWGKRRDPEVRVSKTIHECPGEGKFGGGKRVVRGSGNIVG